MKQFYDYLERISSLNTWDLLKQLRNFDEILKGELKDSLFTERKVFGFDLYKGNLTSKISNVNVTGETKCYPDISLFKIKELAYIEERLDQTTNPWVKSRYAHVLWLAKKNNKFSLTAIKGYCNIINEINNDSEIERINILSTYVECIVFISERTHQEEAETKKIVFSIVKSLSIPIYEKCSVLQVALYSKLFKVNELVSSLDLCERWIDLTNNGCYSQNKEILDFCVILSSKLGLSQSQYYNKLAENQDLIINQHPDEKDFVRYTSIGEKAIFYKNANNSDKYEETISEYTRLKGKFELAKHEFSLPAKENEKLNDYLNLKSDCILRLSSNQILDYFAIGDDILIKDERLDVMTEKRLKSSIKHLFSVCTFDINNNHKQLSDKEKYELERFESYRLSFNFFVYPLIIKTIIFGIINGKINYNSVFKYFEENTWYGQKFDIKVDRSDLDENSNWLSLFAPGLYDFFSQMEWGVMMKDNKISNYILCVDSLSLKFEGALRDFIRLLGGTTTKNKNGELKEQLLEQLLNKPEISKNFSSEDITLFKYVFTNSGWNLRNNVAHCFYPFSSYSFDKAALVFLCILRLGKCKLIRPE